MHTSNDGKPQDSSRNPLDFEAIKKATDIVALIESYGIVLKRQGKDHIGLCPFHADKHPSLRVTRSTGLFRCTSPTCEAAGDAIRWVSLIEHVTDFEAAKKLSLRIPGVVCGNEIPQPKPKSSVPEPRRHELLTKVAKYYAEQLLGEDPKGLQYLQTRGLGDIGLLQEFSVGYANGKLLSKITGAGKQTQDLKSIGVLLPNGTERFLNMIVVPIRDAEGRIVNLYGRNINPQCEKHERHMLLPGPRRGVFTTPQAKESHRIILVEGVMDALSLLAMRMTNVLALFGADGCTEEHLEYIKQSEIQEVVVLFDGDEGGRLGAQRLEEKITAIGRSFRAVCDWPLNSTDANDLLVAYGHAGGLAQLLGMLTFFPGVGVLTPVDDEPSFRSLLPTPVEEDGISIPQVDFESLETLTNWPRDEPSRPTANNGEKELCEGGFYASFEPRKYQLSSIEKPTPSRLRATIKAIKKETDGKTKFHLDTVEFYQAKSRRSFVQDAAKLFTQAPEIVEEDMNRIIELLDAHMAKKADESKVQAIQPEGAERELGYGLGLSPDLIKIIQHDLRELGIVGESVNSLVYYLAITSRRTEDPMAILMLSSSGAGKSHTQDTALLLCPPEDLIKLTSLSGQALFYKGEDSLKHKVLAVTEAIGAGDAHYALRSLISDKKLSIESTIKDVVTGKLGTQTNFVNGPTSVMQTTTDPNTDAETRSRFFILSIDESPAQTRAILEKQRQSHTLQGIRERAKRDAIMRRHHAFQRLLKPVRVLNPYEPYLGYADDRLTFRREHPKYLNLILTITFLHQMQRPLKHDAESGISYIETTLDDIALANEIAAELFGHSMDELSPPARQLLNHLNTFVAAKKSAGEIENGWTRRDLREAIKWSNSRLRIYLQELVEMEYIGTVCGRAGKTFQYQLLCDPKEQEARFLPGLKSIEQIAEEANLATPNANLASEKGNLATTWQEGCAKLENDLTPKSSEGSDPAQPTWPGWGTHRYVREANP